MQCFIEIEELQDEINSSTKESIEIELKDIVLMSISSWCECKLPEIRIPRQLQVEEAEYMLSWDHIIINNDSFEINGVHDGNKLELLEDILQLNNDFEKIKKSQNKTREMKVKYIETMKVGYILDRIQGFIILGTAIIIIIYCCKNKNKREKGYIRNNELKGEIEGHTLSIQIGQ